MFGNDWQLVKDSGIPFPSASGSHLWLQPSHLYPKRKEGAFAERHVSTLCASLQRRFPGGLTEQAWLTAPCSELWHRSPLCKGSYLSGWSYCDSGQSEIFGKEKWPNNCWVGCQWLLIYVVNPTELGPESHQGFPPPRTLGFPRSGVPGFSLMISLLPISVSQVFHLFLTSFQPVMPTPALRAPHDLPTWILQRTRPICMVFKSKSGEESDY